MSYLRPFYIKDNVIGVISLIIYPVGYTKNRIKELCKSNHHYLH